MPEQNLATRRAEARLAMEGDERRQAREGREQAIGGRRVEARLAMESPTHRARREARERASREVAAAASAAARSRHAAAAKLTTEAAAKTEAQATAKQADETARVKTAQEAAAEIKDLRGRPAHLSAIRTLKTDMAEAVSQGGSITGAIIRGGELGTNRGGAPARRSRATLTIILILIFLGIIAAGGTWLYQKWLANSPTSTAATATSTPAHAPFILADHQTDIDVADQTAPTLLGKIRAAAAENQPSETIEELKFSRRGAPLAFRVWQNILGLSFPDDFTRLIEPTFMLGFYRGLAGNIPFIILKTKSTEQSYSSLLAGEKNLPIVWNTLLGQPPLSLPEGKPGELVVTTTSNFRDRVIQNFDTRLLAGPGVVQPALYGFLDSHTIVLTQTPAAFLEILTRFRAGR